MLSPLSLTSEYVQHIQNAQHDFENLKSTLKNNGKDALKAALNHGAYSQETLHFLLGSLCVKGKSDVVAMMLETKSYPPKVLANIVVDALENWQAQAAFALVEELKDESLKTKVLDAALHIAAGKGADLEDAPRLIGQLIKWGANATSTDEAGKTAAQIANACKQPNPEICEFLLFEQLDRENSDSLSTNEVNDAIKVTLAIDQSEFPPSFQSVHDARRELFEHAVALTDAFVLYQNYALARDLTSQIGQTINPIEAHDNPLPVNINLPVKEFFTDEKIMNGETHTFGDISAQYEQGSSLVKAKVTGNPYPIYINLRNGIVTNIVVTGDRFISNLSTLGESGLLTKAACARIEIPD